MMATRLESLVGVSALYSGDIEESRQAGCDEG